MPGQGAGPELGIAFSHGGNIQESLILRRPVGASKDEAGASTSNGRKEQRCSVSFEASPYGLRASG
ncbi:hypothetical protein ELH83_12625 [Rhizobium leguminosarum]|nr:hypothetical protein ELH94_12510 [Rhizobium leguminosarum]TAY88567.1 hypothetical protein ELH83_12625 [Rhizobium leguminosarum]TAY99371.1 hypothetical protein ELH79_13180 [Rhizobium leguminosarum]TAZ10243.1 hypothetical protein ELH78_14065 [Rhizobium leguminosarum]